MLLLTYYWASIMFNAVIDVLLGEQSGKYSVCLYMSVSLIQLLLTPIATLYNNGFTSRVQKSFRAFLRQNLARFL